MSANKEKNAFIHASYEHLMFLVLEVHNDCRDLLALRRARN